MVRFKNRWLIARIDEKKHMGNEGIGDDCKLPSKRDLFLLLSEAVLESFGFVQAGELRDSLVQFSDNKSRLVLIRTPRSLAPKVRAVLTLLTTLPIGAREDTPVVVSVMGVHGSLRTAKKAMITRLRLIYKEYLTKLGPAATTKQKAQVGQSLQTVLQELHQIES